MKRAESRGTNMLFSSQQSGQLSLFFILGIFFLLITGIFIIVLSMNNSQTDASQRELTATAFDAGNIQHFLDACIKEHAPSLLEEIGQRSYLNASETQEYYRYKGEEYPIHCTPLEGALHCLEHVYTLAEVEEQLNAVLASRVEDCLHYEEFEKKGYTVTPGNITINTSIAANEIFFRFDFPFRIERGEFVYEQDEALVILDHPFGMVFRLANDIMNAEATEGYFNKDQWMRDHHLLFTIDKHKPYPYTLYTIRSSLTNTFLSSASDSFAFVFGVRHHDFSRRVGRDYISVLEYGCCQVEHTCYAHTDRLTCHTKGGIYTDSTTCTCSEQFIPSTQDEPAFADCDDAKHGESWCVDEVGVGSRSILYSCHDGKVYAEACKDFQEEVCVRTVEEGKRLAECKPNRWQDCTRCTDKFCCENDLLRDCRWVPENKTTYDSYGGKQCVPKRAPGFSFWEGTGQEICNLGTEYALCENGYCPEEWIDSTAFVCSRLGDCGNRENYLGIETRSGFFETDPVHKAPSTSFQVDFFSLNRDQNLLVRQESQETLTLLPSLLTAGINFLEQSSAGSDELLDYGFCMLWQPPQEGDCEQCMGDPFCSEYKCRSIGENCLYSEDDGFPVCQSREKTQTPFSIDFSSPYFYEEKEINLAGNTIRGYEITEALAPYEPLEFSLLTSAETKCKITYLPDLTYTETPAIWFGDPVFSTEHKVTLRLPETIDIPQKLFDDLSLDSFEDVIELFSTNDPVLKTFFGKGIRDNIDTIANHLNARSYLKELIMYSLGGIENNTYHTFIRCVDQSGTENRQPVVLTFHIDQNLSSYAPPQVISLSPQNNTFIAEENYTLTLYLSKPSECKYGELPQSYSLLSEYFDCEYDPNKRSALEGGSYECSTQTNLKDVFVQCRDNPPEREEYLISFSSTVPEEFNLTVYENQSGFSYNLTENLLSFNLSALENESYYFLSPDQHTLSFVTPFGKQCRAGLPETHFTQKEEMTCDVRNETEECSFVVVPGNYSLAIECLGEEGDRQDSELFSFSYLDASELEIVSLYPTQGELVFGSYVDLRVFVNEDVFTENISCMYEVSGTFEQYQMYPSGEFSFFRRIPLDEKGQYEFSVRCQDQRGRSAEEARSFIAE